MTPTRIPDCIFCKIANGDIPTNLVHEGEDVVAFHDLNPQAPTHILVIPRQHIESLLEITGENAGTLGKLQETAINIARGLGFADDGFRLVTNCGRDGGQTVPHLHLHLLGGRQLSWPPG